MDNEYADGYLWKTKLANNRDNQWMNQISVYYVQSCITYNISMEICT